MKKKIVYIVGDLSNPNGMSQVLSQNCAYITDHSDACHNIIVANWDDRQQHRFRTKRD